MFLRFGFSLVPLFQLFVLIFILIYDIECQNRSEEWLHMIRAQSRRQFGRYKVQK